MHVVIGPNQISSTFVQPSMISKAPDGLHAADNFMLLGKIE